MPVCILDLHSVSKKKKTKTKIRKKQPIFSFNRSFRDSFRAFLVWLLNNLYWTLLTSFTWEFLLILSGLLNWRRWTGLFSPKKPVLPGKRFVFDKHADIFTTVTCIPYLWTLSDRCNILNVFLNGNWDNAKGSFISVIRIILARGGRKKKTGYFNKTDHETLLCLSINIFSFSQLCLHYETFQFNLSNNTRQKGKST